MSLILVTGIIGSGKSEAINVLRTMYHKCIVCDDLAKTVVECRPQWRDTAMGIFGTSDILNANGGIDREFLKRVFGDPRYADQLGAYEDAVAEAVMTEVSMLQEFYPDDPIFVEAAYIPKFIRRYGDRFHHTIFVTADERIRHERLASRGVSPERIRAFERAQPLDIGSLHNSPDVAVIDNSGTRSELAVKVEAAISLWPDCAYTTLMDRKHPFFK